MCVFTVSQFQKFALLNCCCAGPALPLSYLSPIRLVGEPRGDLGFWQNTDQSSIESVLYPWFLPLHGIPNCLRPNDDDDDKDFPLHHPSFDLLESVQYNSHCQTSVYPRFCHCH